MSKRLSALLAVLLAALLCLAACGEGQNAPDGGQEELNLTLALSGEESEQFLGYHLYENLLRWVDGGEGFAVLAPGQAEEYTVETDYTGLATYTFTLRGNITWSDGQAVTAGQFVDAWRRLADPANDLPGRELLAQVGGYDQVQETGDTELLAVSAPDDSTLVVTLSGDSAYFLETVCAGACTMPVRTDQLSGGRMTGQVTNGPYVLESAGGKTVLRRSETYYDASAVGPDRLTLTAAKGGEEDYRRLTDGEADFITALPEAVLQELAGEGTWIPEAVTASYGVVINTNLAPFDDPAIRQAFLLAVDEEALTEQLGDSLLRPAAGLVPYGVSDHARRQAAEAKGGEEDPVLPDPGGTEEPEAPAQLWDFRAHSQELVTVPTSSDYEADCVRARSILAQAGYASGAGFPEISYIYVPEGQADAVAKILQSMWKEQLGVTVTLCPLTQEAYDALLASGTGEDDGGQDKAGEESDAFHMAAQMFTSDVPDAAFYLEPFTSGSASNISGYASDAFDILVASAAAAIAPDAQDARDAYLHDAEAILLSDAPVIPLYCKGIAYRLADGLEGLYRGPNGCWFLSAVRRAAGGDN